MVLAEEMVEFPCRGGSLSRMCEWCWAIKYAQILGEWHSLSAGTDKQAFHLMCS